jgi:hypothetical protein
VGAAADGERGAAQHVSAPPPAQHRQAPQPIQLPAGGRQCPLLQPPHQLQLPHKGSPLLHQRRLVHWGEPRGSGCASQNQLLNFLKSRHRRLWGQRLLWGRLRSRSISSSRGRCQAAATATLVPFGLRPITCCLLVWGVSLLLACLCLFGWLLRLLLLLLLLLLPLLPLGFALLLLLAGLLLPFVLRSGDSLLLLLLPLPQLFQAARRGRSSRGGRCSFLGSRRLAPLQVLVLWRHGLLGRHRRRSCSRGSRRGSRRGSLLLGLRPQAGALWLLHELGVPQAQLFQQAPQL